jgi:hypothetical protein
MLQSVHAEVTRRALEKLLSPHALQFVVVANLQVDSLWNQWGHDELHFDNNAFGSSRDHIRDQRKLIQPALERGDAKSAWRAFGRLTHTAQDFYSHSNYVDLWLACQPNGMIPAPAEIDPLDDSLVESPSLRSGKAYLPFGALSFVPGLRRLVLPLMPGDSHARMNLDSAVAGPMFAYAYQAAVKRTRVEYQGVVDGLPPSLAGRFTDLTSDSALQAGAA